jgi:transcription elongation factor Elf1
MLAGLNRYHWEFNSECPHCGKTKHIKVPKGQQVVRVYCEHCPHGFEYTHIVQEYIEIEENIKL